MLLLEHRFFSAATGVVLLYNITSIIIILYSYSGNTACYITIVVSNILENIITIFVIKILSSPFALPMVTLNACPAVPTTA